MSNYYDRPSYDPPKGVCYLTDPRYEEGCNEWQQREYCGVCYNVFMTPRDANGGGVDINACKSDIVKRDQYRAFLQAFDWALSNPISPLACCVDAPFNWLGNACCRYTDDTTAADGYNFATSPIGYYKDNRDKYVRDWCSYRYDNDFITPIGFESKDRMEGQIDFMTVYGNWKGAGVSGSIDFGVCDCRGCMTRCLTANNGVATETLDGDTYNLDACEVGMVIPYSKPYSFAWLNMSVNGATQNMARWGGDPYDGCWHRYECVGRVQCTCEVCECVCSLLTPLCWLTQKGDMCEATLPYTAYCTTFDLSLYKIAGCITNFPKDTDECGCPLGLMFWTCGYSVDGNMLSVCAHFATDGCAQLIQCACDVVDWLANNCNYDTMCVSFGCGTYIDGSVRIRSSYTSHYCGNVGYSTCVLYSDVNASACNYSDNYIVSGGITIYHGSTCFCDVFYSSCNCYSCSDVYECVSCKYCVDVCRAINETYLREPCETDGVLYFGLPNYAIGSIPIKRIKCQVDNTPTYTYMRNDSDSAAQCWSKRDISFAETENKYKFCFITFSNVCDAWSLDIPKMLSCGVFFYLCSYKCNSGQYINMCKGSINALTKEVCSAKMLYYTFQGFSVGGAYL